MVTGGEFAFIERLRAMLAPPPDGQVWIGDDAAVLGDGYLLAVDALVAGVHFDLAWSDASDAGWKALAVNLSDIAAMGGEPLAAVAALVLPATPGLADDVARGLGEASRALGCPVVGGDTTSGPVLMLTVAVLGRAPATGAVLRSGARPGDAVLVTGTMGGGRLGLRARGAVHGERLRRPTPRLAQGAAAAQAGATAMIDTSDGFAADLGHVLDASGVGVVIEAAALPGAEGATLDDVLGGGDDYELVICAPDAARVIEAFVARGLPPAIAVGRCTADPARVLLTADGTQPLERAGWEHPVI